MHLPLPTLTFTLLPLLSLFILPTTLASRPPLSEIPIFGSLANTLSDMSHGAHGHHAGNAGKGIGGLDPHALAAALPAAPMTSENDRAYIGKQATRAQVVARHKWRARKGYKRADAIPSGRPLSCADYSQYDLRLTRQSDGAAFTVAGDEDDSTAHVGFGEGDGSVFRLEADCRLLLPDAGLYANISPGRKRDNLYFNSDTSILVGGYRSAVCSISGGGNVGLLTCAIPGTAVNTFCLIGETLIIRQGACEARLGESGVSIVASVL